MKSSANIQQQWKRAVLIALTLWAAMQMAATLGQVSAFYATQHQTFDSIKSRLSLDLPFLDVGNTLLKTPPNKATLQRYMARVNHSLTTFNAQIRVVAIQAVPAPDAANYNEFTEYQGVVLQNVEQSIQLKLASNPLHNAIGPSWIAIIAALILAPIYVLSHKLHPSAAAATPMPPSIPVAVTQPIPKLTINLANKSIGNGVNGLTVQLQNKPLCFYAALLRYCIANPSSQLYHHNDIPNELTNYANKVFIRLMELGHTKRKRPDFNANLDKTLSEIRAALDEVFTGYSEEKARYYPPRAQGEGSRSKQHSYALPTLHASDIEIIGD